MKIPDLNVLLHAHNRGSPLHREARAWLEAALASDETVGLAWVVVLGFLRIATHPRVMPRPISTEQACGAIDALFAYPPVRIVQPGPEHWLELQRLLREAGSAANLTTDSHLAALAIEHGATLVSYDRDFGRFVSLRWERPAH